MIRPRVIADLAIRSGSVSISCRAKYSMKNIKTCWQAQKEPFLWDSSSGEGWTIPWEMWTADQLLNDYVVGSCCLQSPELMSCQLPIMSGTVIEITGRLSSARCIASAGWNFCL